MLQSVLPNHLSWIVFQGSLLQIGSSVWRKKMARTRPRWMIGRWVCQLPFSRCTADVKSGRVTSLWELFLGSESIFFLKCASFNQLDLAMVIFKRCMYWALSSHCLSIAGEYVAVIRMSVFAAWESKKCVWLMVTFLWSLLIYLWKLIVFVNIVNILIYICESWCMSECWESKW